MSNFALLATDPAGDLISSVNYLLATQGQTNANAILGNTLTANVTSGQITTAGDPNYLAYLYQYINVRYADSADGSVNFSTSPTNRFWYGVRNSAASAGSSNPADYVWTAVASPGFSTNRFLFYKVIGGQQINFVVDTSAPTNYQQTQDGVAINLFNITGANGTPGTDGVNAWQANINYPSILYTMTESGTYDNANTIVIATFSNSAAAATASIYANVDANGSITFSNISVNPDITLSTVNSNFAATTTFRHISNVSVATVVQTVPSGPPQLLTQYSGGQYFISSNDGSWQPAKQANNAVQTTANVTVTRSNTTLSSFQRIVSYFTNNGTWTLTSTGTDVNIGRIAFGNVLTSNSSYYLPFLYSDLGGNAAGSIAISVVSGGANGSPGAPGERGFIPLAYIITASDPTSYTDAQYTYAFEAPRTNVAAPIGTGYTPITGDTAQFTYTNPPFEPITVFKTFNANTLPNWDDVDGQVIDGNVLVSGSVTANKLNVNDLYALNIQSTNADFGNVNSNGYWMAASNGDARFGGNVSIGANLNVQGLITGGTLNANVVTGTQLAYNSVGVNQILANAVTQQKIADRAISNAKIALGTITNELVEVGSLLGNVFANGAVTGQQIANNAITTGLIAANAITNAVIADATITNVQIAGKTITGLLIANETITGNLVALNTITGNLIATNTITGNLVALSTITGNLIANATITNSLIATGTITGNNIQANTITGNNIAAGTITTDKLAANAITTNTVVSTNATFGSNTSPGFWLDGSTGNARFGGQLSVGSIISDSGLNANVVTNTQLAYDSVGVNQILANAVTQSKIADRAISNAKIALGTIDNQLIQVGSLLGNVFANGAVTGQQIANAAITTGLIANSAITGALIANATITNVAIAAKTITGTLIANSTITGNLVALNTITGSLIANNTITGNLVALSTITGNLIANATITNTLIATGTITGNNIQANTITGNNIAAGTITTDKLAAGTIVVANSIQSNNATFGSNTSVGFWLDANTGNARFGGQLSVGSIITDGGLNANVITSTQLAYDSVTTNAILANAVVQGKIADRAISNAKIALGTITNQLIQVNSLFGNVFSNGAISTEQIANNAITTGLISANAVTGAKIADATITNVQIANKTITASLIANNTITGTLIANNTITGSLIANSTITGSLIAVNTITGNLIANNTITNNLIATGTITAGLIQANAITTAAIAAGSVTTDKLAANVLTVNTVVSSGATLGSNTSAGFWLDGATGNARFGNSVSIGNSLTVGNLIINSSLANAVVGYNNLQPGLIPTPIGNSYVPTSITLTSAGQYDWAYTSGSIYGYTETLAYTKIFVTAGMAANSTQTAYKVSFSATWNGTLFPAYPNSPSFYLFYNDSWYGGSDQTVIIPLSGSPAPTGARANIGSIIYPQFGFYPQGTSAGTINFSGNVNMGTTMYSPFGGHNLTANSNIVIGCAFLNGSGTGGNVGTQAFTNINFTVTT